MRVSRQASEKDVLAATLYAEARGEPEEGQIWVVWVIRNRALKKTTSSNRYTWKDVCLSPQQFECWNGREDIHINDIPAFRKCLQIIDEVLVEADDPTGGCDHYNNPDEEGYPPWTKNCRRVKRIGNHQFYKSL
jgi:N-acetylmuramoyl-L-alanine amidase